MAAGDAVIAAGADRFTAARGEGFFINSGVLHAAWERGRSGCRIHSAVFHPRLAGGSLDSVFWSNYVQPLMDAPSRKALHFDGSEAWHGAAISESECVRCFQSVISTPPIQYLKQFRIQRAAGLLASTDLGVAEIGALCGFEDASYFSRSFREAKGHTPSRYRESLRAGARQL